MNSRSNPVGIVSSSPEVARNELPWDTGDGFINPNGVAPIPLQNRSMRPRRW